MKRVTQLNYNPIHNYDRFQSTPSVKRVTLIILTIGKITSDFNPHPLWRGWRNVFDWLWRQFWFQSTPSVKRVTSNAIFAIKIIVFQSTPSVKRVTILRLAMVMKFRFQSTPSVKRVTPEILLFHQLFPISIHTLCEEGDNVILPFVKIINYFNPHPLWRGWR